MLEYGLYAYVGAQGKMKNYPQFHSVCQGKKKKD